MLAHSAEALTLAYLRVISHTLIELLGAVVVIAAPIFWATVLPHEPSQGMLGNIGAVLLFFSAGVMAMVWPLVAFMALNETIVLYLAHGRYRRLHGRRM